jgi:hypothetical protein
MVSCNPLFILKIEEGRYGIVSAAQVWPGHAKVAFGLQELVDPCWTRRMSQAVVFVLVSTMWGSQLDHFGALLEGVIGPSNTRA